MYIYKAKALSYTYINKVKGECKNAQEETSQMERKSANNGVSVTEFSEKKSELQVKDTDTTNAVIEEESSFFQHVDKIMEDNKDSKWSLQNKGKIIGRVRRSFVS